ncbi:MAG: heat-inducible transcriptional repressor HrcA [Chloroflexota bacterium]|nr:heat-inducible transcriptional repressor HrcA [Chloroflexota bacterium]
MEDLTPRRQAILESVVREFIATATPIGSRTIAERCDLGISPATVRNEMACLEEQGYLTHPYTSAGRIPTDEGYRYFVEHLMEEVELPLTERHIICHRFHQVHLETEQWLRLAVTALAQATRSAAVVTPPRPPSLRFQHLELVSLHGPASLLILILQGGVVKQQMLILPRSPTQMELNRTSTRLNTLFEGLSVEGIQTTLPQLSPLGRQVAASAIEVMEQVGERIDEEIYYDGLINVLRQPEFTVVESAHRLIRALEEQRALRPLMAEVSGLAMGRVQVIIGKEGPWDELSECSFVLARYGVDDRASGTLGALGPRRMAYERIVSTVRYVASLMSDIIRKLYGNH